MTNASNEPFIAHDPTPGVIASRKSSPEEDRNNQNRLLELLTARGNVAEVDSPAPLSRKQSY